MAKSMARSMRPVTDEQAAAFLTLLADGETVAHAAAKAGVTCKQKLYRRRQADPDFAAAWDDAYRQGADRLEAEAQRRAVDGVLRERYNGEGVLIQQETVYSDRLLQFLLKTRDRAKYGERHDVDVSSGGKEIKIVVAPQLADIFGAEE